MRDRVLCFTAITMPLLYADEARICITFQQMRLKHSRRLHVIGLVVFTFTFTCMLLVSAYTKTAVSDVTALVLQVFASYLAFCGIGLRNAQLYERSLLENRRNQVCSLLLRSRRLEPALLV